MRVTALAALTVIACGLATAGCEGDSPSEPPGPSPEERLSRASAEPVIVRREDGVVESVSADVPLPPGSDPEARARAFLDDHGGLFGLTDPATELRTVDTRPKALGGQVVHFVRLIGGRPVFGSAIKVHSDEGDRVRFVSARLPRHLDVGSDPALSEADATATALDGIADGEVRTVTLGVLDQGVMEGGRGDSRLAYRVEVDAAPETSPVRFVDAIGGGLLREWPTSEPARRRMTYGLGGSAPSSRLGLWARRTLLISEGGPEVADPHGDAVLAHDLVGEAYGYYYDRFGRDGWHPDVELVTYVQWGGDPSLDAFFGATGGNPALFFREGHVVGDILVHEYTHGVVTLTLKDENGVYSGFAHAGEAHGLGEGLADVFAAFAREDGDRWVIGDARAAGPIRNLRMPGATEIVGLPYPSHRSASQILDYDFALSDPRYAAQREQLLALRGHFISTVFSHAAYLMAEGGTHAVTGVAVRGMGIAKAEQVAYLVLSEYLASSSDYAAFRDAARQAALEMIRTGRHGMGLTDCATVLDAFAAVEVGSPDGDADCWDDAEDNCPAVFNPEQDVGACDGPPPPPVDAGPVCGGEAAPCGGDPECCDQAAGPGICILQSCTHDDGCGRVSDVCDPADPESCCGLLTCAPLSAADDPRCCARDTFSCELDTDCCGAMTCVGGRCSCRSTGETCLTGEECCGGLFCSGGLCTG